MHARLDSDRRCCRLWARLLTNDNPSALSTISATSETHYSSLSLFLRRTRPPAKTEFPCITNQAGAAYSPSLFYCRAPDFFTQLFLRVRFRARRENAFLYIQAFICMYSSFKCWLAKMMDGPRISLRLLARFPNCIKLLLRCCASWWRIYKKSLG